MEESLRSVEHVFPDAIGGSLTLADMCKSCNNHLGDSADVHLTDHVLIKFDRQRFNLAGKGGAVPNPFERGTLHEADGESNVRWEPGYLYRSPSKFVVDGRHELRLDPRDASKADEIRQKVTSRGRSATTLDVKVVSAVGTVANSTASFPLETSMESCTRALVKIAYEVGTVVLGDRYLDCPAAQMVRDCLRDPLGEPARFGIRAMFRDGAQRSGLSGAGESLLIGGVVPTGDVTLAYVRIFNRCEMGLFLDVGADEGVGPDGTAYVIDVASRGRPVRTTLRALGWFGPQPAETAPR